MFAPQKNLFSIFFTFWLLRLFFSYFSLLLLSDFFSYFSLRHWWGDQAHPWQRKSWTCQFHSCAETLPRWPRSAPSVVPWHTLDQWRNGSTTRASGLSPLGDWEDDVLKELSVDGLQQGDTVSYDTEYSDREGNYRARYCIVISDSRRWRWRHWDGSDDVFIHRQQLFDNGDTGPLRHWTRRSQRKLQGIQLLWFSVLIPLRVAPKKHSWQDAGDVWRAERRCQGHGVRYGEARGGNWPVDVRCWHEMRQPQRQRQGSLVQVAPPVMEVTCGHPFQKLIDAFMPQWSGCRHSKVAAGMNLFSARCWDSCTFSCGLGFACSALPVYVGSWYLGPKHPKYLRTSSYFLLLTSFYFLLTKSYFFFLHSSYFFFILLIFSFFFLLGISSQTFRLAHSSEPLFDSQFGYGASAFVEIVWWLERSCTQQIVLLEWEKSKNKSSYGGWKWKPWTACQFEGWRGWVYDHLFCPPVYPSFARADLSKIPKCRTHVLSLWWKFPEIRGWRSRRRPSCTPTGCSGQDRPGRTGNFWEARPSSGTSQGDNETTSGWFAGYAHCCAWCRCWWRQEYSTTGSYGTGHRLIQTEDSVAQRIG